MNSLVSAEHKFKGTMPYCAAPHFFYKTSDQLIQAFAGLPNNSMIGVYDPTMPKKLEISGAKLLEAIGYDDNSYHLFMLKQEGFNICLSFPEKIEDKYIPGISFAFICTNDEPYISLLRNTIEWYKKWHLDNYEISVVLFGEAELPSGIKIQKEPIEKFHMAYARNCSLQNATYDHIFMLDADVRMTGPEAWNIIEKYYKLPNDGVFNLKNDPTIGNGLYFGNRHVMIENGYDERFKNFWGEDTEHLMNYSRIGKIPIVVFEGFQRLDHVRNKTLSNKVVTSNFNLMSNLLNSGSREWKQPGSSIALP